MHGAGTHHPGTFRDLLCESGTRQKSRQNGGGDELFFHDEQQMNIRENSQYLLDAFSIKSKFDIAQAFFINIASRLCA
jgi:hypothetical protein